MSEFDATTSGTADEPRSTCTIEFSNQPADRGTYQRAGATLAPHAVFTVKGPVKEGVRYNAYVTPTGTSGNSPKQAVKAASGEGQEGGSVNFSLGNLTVFNPGAYYLYVSVFETRPDGSDYSCVAKGESKVFHVA